MKRLIYCISILFTLSSLPACMSVKQPEVRSVESVKVLSMTEEYADLAVDLKINNPNKMKILVKSCDVNAYINKKYIGKVTVADKVLIPKKSENTYTVLLKADMKEVKKVMPSLMFANNALVNLKGDIQVKAKGINKKVAVDVNEKITRKDLKSLNVASAD